MKTLGSAILAATLAELDATGGKPSAERIAAYFAPCERNGRPLGLRAGNWCAAGACFVAMQVVKTDQLEAAGLPHRYRAAGQELEQDAKRLGAWCPIADVRAGRSVPAPGDLLILSRGTESWQRHVARVESFDGKVFRTIDANGTGAAWARVVRPAETASLLGVIRLPSSPPVVHGGGDELVALAALVSLALLAT
ncbi:MAG: CHAP domain-containing protein [Myxococcales bacterium]|nr:CHAP domain-containing protein [Myxococcales bacterium]